MEHENELKEALDFVSPSALTYDEWLMVGMALKDAGLPVTLWEQWSTRDAGRYHKGECVKKWESFHGGGASPVTASSIFQLAYSHGWSGPAGHALDWNDDISVGTGAQTEGRLVDPRWVEAHELALPEEWHPADQLKRYLQALFEPDEYVAYVTESFMAADRRRPAKGSWTRTAGQLITELDACGGDLGKVVGDCDPEVGAWICFNPVDGTGRKDANITAYRYALVECDNMELGKQQAIIKQLELPCAALVYSGDENSADQMAKFCNQFDLVCRALDCAVIYCHHHSKGAQGGKRSMDRASGSGVFARDPDAMLDMTELVPTDAIREQLHNKAACRVIKAMLDKRGHADAYGLDDTLSRHRMLTIAKEKLGLADLRAIDAEVAAAEKKADGMTAWRIEGTLREFARFDPVNLWFDYPVHKPDTSLLEDLQPDSDFKTLGSRGAAKRWGDKGKVTKDKKAELDTAFEACMMDGEVTVYSMAEYMGLKPDTVRRRLKADGGFWIDGADIGRKEPGSAG